MMKLSISISFSLLVLVRIEDKSCWEKHRTTSHSLFQQQIAHIFRCSIENKKQKKLLTASNLKRTCLFSLHIAYCVRGLDLFYLHGPNIISGNPIGINKQESELGSAWMSSLFKRLCINYFIIKERM